jgi:osmotically-inducible protein OsmY
MAERYSENEDYRRRSERRGGGSQYGRSRASRFEDDDEIYGEGQDEERRGVYGAYGGGYGQGGAWRGGAYETQRRYQRDQGGLPGQSYGGGYRDRGEWDREYGMRSDDRRQGERGWRGPGASLSEQDYGYGETAPGAGYYSGAGQGDSRQGYLTRGGRQQWGRFAGRGPRNYTRSDERIRDDINDRLTDDPELDASDIEVKVNNGDIILGGSVESRLAKRRAEDIVDSVSGVKNVQNNLRVQMSEEEPSRSSRRGRGDGEKMQ